MADFVINGGAFYLAMPPRSPITRPLLAWRTSFHELESGRLEAWGASMIDAIEAIQALAAQRIAERAQQECCVSEREDTQ